MNSQRFHATFAGAISCVYNWGRDRCGVFSFSLVPPSGCNFFSFFGETCLNAINQFGAGSSKDACINSSEILYQRMENALRFS